MFAARYASRALLADLIDLGDLDVDLTLAFHRASALDDPAASVLVVRLGEHAAVHRERCSRSEHHDAAAQGSFDRFAAAVGAVLRDAQVQAGAAVSALRLTGCSALTWKWLMLADLEGGKAEVLAQLVADPLHAFGPDIARVATSVHSDARADVIGHELCHRYAPVIKSILQRPYAGAWARALGPGFVALSRRDPDVAMWLDEFLLTTIATEPQLSFARALLRSWTGDLSSLLVLVRLSWGALQSGADPESLCSALGNSAA